MYIDPPQDTLIIRNDGTQPTLEYQVVYISLHLRKAGDKAETGYIFQEEINTRIFTFNLSEGKFGKASIFDIGTFEVVNTHQWEAMPPATLRTKKLPFTDVFNEPPLWDIANVNNATGQRIIAMRSHAARDDVFTICNRLTSLLNYSRMICEPWRTELIADSIIPTEIIKESIAVNSPRFYFSRMPIRAIPPNAIEFRSKYIYPPEYIESKPIKKLTLRFPDFSALKTLTFPSVSVFGIILALVGGVVALILSEGFEGFVFDAYDNLVTGYSLPRHKSLYGNAIIAVLIAFIILKITSRKSTKTLKE